MSFSYDGAHRLVGVVDSSGNRVGYTLDAMGNRAKEQAKDPRGNLAHQITRVFNSMNQPLKVILGATQQFDNDAEIVDDSTHIGFAT